MNLSRILGISGLILLCLGTVAETKTLKLVMNAGPISMDPHRKNTGGILQYSHMVFDPLIRRRQNKANFKPGSDVISEREDEFEPRLATGWKRDTEDERIMIFHLRKEVKFHSGNPFTAEDVAWTMKRLKKSESFKALFDPFEDVIVIDPHTVRISTKKPYGLFLDILTYFFPMDSKFYEGNHEKYGRKDEINEPEFEETVTFADKHESGSGKYTVAREFFKITEKTISGMKEEGIPKDILDKVKKLKHQYYVGRDNLITELEQTVGKDLTGNQKESIINNSKRLSRFDEETLFEQFGDYWDRESKGNVSRIILRSIENDKERVNALLSGEADFIMPVPPQLYDKTVKNATFQLSSNEIATDRNNKLVTMSGSRIIHLQLNQKHCPPFKIKEVRQALAYAIDNKLIVDKIMKGAATPACQQGPEGFAGYKKTLRLRHNLKKAKKLMAEAGYEDGFECSMIAPNNRYVNDERVAEEIVTMLKEIEVNVYLRTMPKKKWIKWFKHKQGDMLMIGWHPDTEDSANYGENLMMCPGKGYGEYNFGNYCNPKVNDLLNKSQTEPNENKRKEYLQQVEQILYDDAAFIPLHWENLSWAGKKNIGIEDIVNIQNYPYFGDLVID